MKSQRIRGMTLVELLVVIAIIAMLVALLLPAVQSAREAARRTMCRNHLKQIGLALHNYHDTYSTFPAGYDSSNQLIWSGSVLPFMEHNPLYDLLDLNQSWIVNPNAHACAQYVSLYQCPSSAAPRSVAAGQGIPNRVPSNYLACASGTVARESGPGPQIKDPDQDGMFYQNSKVRMADITDGTSGTIAVGEALFRMDITGSDGTGQTQVVDHWYIGSPEIGGNETSEGLGSTAAAINSLFLPGVHVDEKELCFSSHHPGGVQVVFADGHVEFITAQIAPVVWRAMGTRASGEVH